MKTSDCFICRKHSEGPSVPDSIVYEDDVVYAGHILPPDPTDVYLGYLIVETKRHIAGLGDLRDAEAAHLGVLLRNTARALSDSEGVEHVYSFVLGDAVQHLHVHIVPRYSHTPKEYWGVRIADWPEAPRGGRAEIAATCARLRRSLDK